MEKDGSQLFVDGLTATASSEETAGENAPASNAVDGNPRTFWHSKWSGAAAQPPHWIDVALPKAQEVSGLTYMPRSDSKNGALKAYRVEVKTADGDYQTVAEGRVDKVNTAQTIMFEPIKNATNVRLHYLESEGGFATAGEIKVHTMLPPAT